MKTVFILVMVIQSTTAGWTYKETVEFSSIENCLHAANEIQEQVMKEDNIVVSNNCYKK